MTRQIPYPDRLPGGDLKDAVIEALFAIADGRPAFLAIEEAADMFDVDDGDVAAFVGDQLDDDNDQEGN